MSHNLARDQRRGRRGTVEGRKRWRMRPTLMALEDRRLLSTIVVNNPTDTPVAGQTDLRQAIVQANTTGGVSHVRERKRRQGRCDLGEALPTTIRHFWPQFDQWLDRIPDSRFAPWVIYHKRFLIWWGLSLYLFQLGSRRQLDFDLDARGTQVLRISIAWPKPSRRRGRCTIPWNFWDTPARRTPGMDHHAAPPHSHEGPGRRPPARALCRGPGCDWSSRVPPAALPALFGLPPRHSHRVPASGLGGQALGRQVWPCPWPASSSKTRTACRPLRRGPQARLRTQGASRLLPQLRRDPELRLCLSGDSLYACGRTLQLAKDYHCDYVFTFKPGHMPAVWEDFQSLLSCVPKTRGNAPRREASTRSTAGSTACPIGMTRGEPGSLTPLNARKRWRAKRPRSPGSRASRSTAKRRGHCHQRRTTPLAH